MEDGVSRRRRGIPEDTGEVLGSNPVAEDLPNSADNALGPRIRGQDEVRAGADNDLMAAAEPDYFGTSSTGARGFSATATDDQTGPGATRRDVDREESAEPELLPDEERTTITVKEFRQIQATVQNLLQSNKELTERLQSEGRMGTTPPKGIAMDSLPATGVVGGHRSGSLEPAIMGGDGPQSRYLNESSLGMVDRYALDRHFSQTGMPAPAYQCEVRQGLRLSTEGQASEGAAGGWSESHNLLELEDAPEKAEQLRRGPVFVQGVGWVVYLGDKSSASGSIQPPGTGGGSEHPNSPPCIGSPEVIGKGGMLRPPNPWAAQQENELSGYSNPWLAQAESEWMARARVSLEEEIERRARKSLEQRPGVNVPARKVRSRDDGFDTARSTQIVPPLPLPLEAVGADRETALQGGGMPPPVSQMLEDWLRYEAGPAVGREAERHLQASPFSVSAIAPLPPGHTGVLPSASMPAVPRPGSHSVMGTCGSDVNHTDGGTQIPV